MEKSFLDESKLIHERDILINLQKDHTRWFTKEEFNRLAELNKILFENAGSPFEEKQK